MADALTHPVEAAAWDLVLLLCLQLPADERLEVVRRAATDVAQGGTLLMVAHDRTNLERGSGGPRDPDVLSGAPPQSSSCAASASTDSMNSSTMSNTTWREVLDTFMVPTTWPTK